MKIYIITFRSITPAQRAEKLFRRVGYECSIRRTPRWMEEQGCGYSLRVKSVDAEGCIGLLRSNGLPFRKIYLQEKNGSTQEIAL